jgi:putative ABC transport system permease protein
VDGIKAIVPVAYTSASSQTKRKKESCSLIATDGEYAQIRNVQIAQGRFFSSSDNASTRRVVVINQKLADDLFGVGSDVLDQKIMLAGKPVIVIGVCKSATGIFSGGERPEAYIPISLYYTMYQSNGAYELDGTAVSKDRVDEVAQQVIRIMQLRHGDKEKNVYRFFNMEQEMQSANKVTGILTLIIGAIAGISLLVGGIGVMNIMLVSVTERTREIGIRIAIGACRQDIMRQFLIESTVLSLLGGLIGIILGMISAALICAAIRIPFSISLPTVLIASLFSVAVGIFFGLYPANRAAKLDPIDALRYE